MSEDLDIEETLRKQDEALALLERLRIAESTSATAEMHPGGGRRDFRRWPAPEGVTVELHNGDGWKTAAASDLGIGGVRVTNVPTWLDGPVPVRLKSASVPAILALADLMWRDGKTGAAGLRFEFQDPEERDQWTAALIDALLARYALV
ncbi:MAG: PilZ domain-containing protein [Armatimonadota bacterium]|nr:PilZ domain-containing protein [Armatimonadota bacterium]